MDTGKNDLLFFAVGQAAQNICGEKDGGLYLSLIHGVVTYVDNWSRVSLGGPYMRETKRETYSIWSVFLLIKL